MIHVQHQYLRPETLSTAGVRYKASILPYVNSSTVTTRIPSENVLSTIVTSRRNTLYPDLTSSKQALPVQRTEITAFTEDYQQPAAPKKMRAVTAYLQVM
jgi:hypothetical protein